MKNLITFCMIACLTTYLSSTAIAEEIVIQDNVDNAKTVRPIPEWKERRTVVPYYPRAYRPRYVPQTQQMPYPSNKYDGTYHFLPHIYIGPNQGGGFGSHFGLRLGNPFLGSHGFQFGINLY